jgi:high-affinity K+ transport system ATPase subunit B
VGFPLLRLGGIVAPFIGTNAIDMVLAGVGLV